MGIMSQLLLSTAGSSFVKLFTEMQPIVIILFIVGVLLCAVEIFTPGFGWFGICGILAIIASLVMRMLQGGDMWMFLYMIVIYAVVFVGLFLVTFNSIKKGRLSRSGIFNVGSSVSEGKTEGTKDYDHLLGKTGKTLTFLRPIGQVDFDGEVIDAMCSNGYVDIAEQVVVVQVEGGTVRVKKV